MGPDYNYPEHVRGSVFRGGATLSLYEKGLLGFTRASLKVIPLAK